MSALLGYAAACEVVPMEPGSELVIIAERHDRTHHLPTMEQITVTRAIKDLMTAQNYLGTIQARGVSFGRTLELFEATSTPSAEPATETGSTPSAFDHPRWVVIIYADGLAPGMNMATRMAVRLGIGHDFMMLGVYGGFPGLLDGDAHELTWADIEG